MKFKRFLSITILFVFMFCNLAVFAEYETITPTRLSGYNYNVTYNGYTYEKEVRYNRIEIPLGTTVNVSIKTEENASIYGNDTSIDSTFFSVLSSTGNKATIKALKAGTTTLRFYQRFYTGSNQTSYKKILCSVPVTVTAPLKISLSSTSKTIYVGKTAKLQATITPAELYTGKNLKWTSSSSTAVSLSIGGTKGDSYNGVETLYTLPSAGAITLTGNVAGTSTITCETLDGTVKAICNVTVITQIVPISSITINKTSLSLSVDETATLSASVLPQDATYSDITWASSNSKVATVNTNGRVTAISAGKATITAKATSSTGTIHSASCTVTVTNPIIPITSIAFSETTASLLTSETMTLNLDISPTNATYSSIVWSSSNEDVATIKNGCVTAISSGVATISAKTTSNSKTYTVSCTVTVSNPTVKEEVCAPSANISNGSVVSGTYINLSTQTEGAKIYYTLDGSQPSPINGILFSSGIAITSDTTLKAIATKDGMNDSKVSQFTYTIIENDIPTIQVENITAKPGNSVDVKISLKNNPGITTMRFDISYDTENMTLTKVTDAGTLSGQVHSSDYSAHPYSLYWENATTSENIVVNDTIATLTFLVNENIEPGTYPVNISYDLDNYDIFNADLETVEFDIEPGQIIIRKFEYGDVNNDEKVNALDSVLMSRYIAKWPDVEINSEAADVNSDQKVNALDSVILKRHIAKWADYSTLPY